MDIDISCVHELWAAPKENWLDHFVNTARFKKLLSEEKKSDAQKEELRTLVTQFAEQAVQAEIESVALIKKQFGQDDISFLQRKASCLWLCCLASLAAIDWHFETLMEKPTDVLLVNSIFDRIEDWRETLTSPSSLSFISFLLSRWILFVHAYFRIPPPEAKQTVSNPCNQLDVALQRFEHAKTLVAKLRTRLDDSLRLLDEMATATEKKPMFVPRSECFLDPFLQHGGLSLSIGIVGPNVLVAENTLCPRVPSGDGRDTVVLSAESVVQKIHFELASSFFCLGGRKMVQAVGSLKQLFKCLPLSSESPAHPLIRIDERKVNGFASAFRFPLPYSTAAPSTSQADVMGTITSTDPCPRRVPQRRYGTRRDRRAEEQARSLAQPVSSIRLDPLVMAEDAWTGGGTVGWREKMEKEGREERKRATVETLRTLCTPPVSSTLSPAGRAVVRGVARLLCATGMGSQPLLDCLSLPSAPSTSLAGVAKPAPAPPPSAASIKAIAASDKPYWTLLTSFDVEELQTAYKLEGSQYSRPAMLSKYPESLMPLVLAPFNELHALLLGKLQQLTVMGDHERWQGALNAFVPLFTATQPLLEMTIYEATRVQMLCFNRQLFSPHSNLIQHHVNTSHSVATKLVKISQVPPIVAPMVAFLLNKSEFSYICSQLDKDPTTGVVGTNNLLINVGRVLAAYGTMRLEPKAKSQLPQLAATWHGIVSPYFEAVASKRRHDGFTTMHLRETSRLRIDLIKMFEAIKLSFLQEFLISYFASIYTTALAARGRAHLRIYSPSAELFVGMSLQLAHVDSVEEVLTLLLDRALSIEPHKATLLRTKADFAYVRNQLSEAAVVYCELLVATKASLTMPLERGDGVVDDSVWSHLRICLRKTHQQTLAACVCQLFKTGRNKEYRKAAEAIQDRSCLDASDDCFGLIYDMQLAEALTDAYRKRGQQQKLEALLDVISSPTMNLNNGAEAVEREVRRKQKRLLNTLASMHFGVHA